METVLYRLDYAKFLITCEPDRWQTLYHALNLHSHQRKYHTEWLKSHKVNRLYYNAAAGMETWAVDIWGEWAGIVEVLPAHWLVWLKRLDVRATLWEATEDSIVTTGHHLERTVNTFNITSYSSRPGSKRLGRDRGGKGFAIGSKKSDLRITIYKRTNEPCAQEFQCTGRILQAAKERILDRYSRMGDTMNVWHAMRFEIEATGSRRLARVMELGGLGTYWPTYGTAEPPTLPPYQTEFSVPSDDEGDEARGEQG